MQYYLVKFLSRIVCCLPIGIRRSLGTLIGRLCWPLVPAKRKKMATANIKRSLGVDEDRASLLAKASAVRFGPMFMEVLHMPRLTPENIGNYVKLTGQEHLEDALKLGRGAVLATAHSGNWELLGAALAMHGFPLVAVVQRQTSHAMDKFINEYRTKAGMHVTYKTGVREMVKLLCGGKIIGLLMDQDNRRHGVFVEFFSRPASTPQGAAALGRLNHAPIVPAFITTNSDGTHTAIIHPPVMAEKTADRDHDILVTTQKLTQIIENHIRQYPQEWFWLHDRWKTPPPAGKTIGG
ncbi:lysophospholipid acyltransferase family protein [Sporomusa sphaeroides DSM 2875]|uniref:lysophospholipid acyltransferase family protein n=1 Tax=Sporomusa sphaeroides TaxID=47679 RepID=UPI00202F1754|nr:lysophospholipid acyltransferase family protein [Sporomusa sphaeroides]MCM0757982.1 lysophospholipid acyltransferase family protein [Sporomusa sphaeroides DSM 2875]